MKKRKKSRNTVIVNLFAGPGSGKSTMASGIFSELKWEEIECEILLEYAKSLTWEESFKKLDDQIYIFGKQLHGFNILRGKVDVVVTDSPLMLSIIYGQHAGMSEIFAKLVSEEHQKMNSLNYFIERKKKYNPNGRRQNLKEAQAIDRQIKGTLKKYKIPYKVLPGERASIDVIVQDIIKHITPVKKKIKRRKK
jgi:hypothetical protein